MLCAAYVLYPIPTPFTDEEIVMHVADSNTSSLMKTLVQDILPHHRGNINMCWSTGKLTAKNEDVKETEWYMLLRQQIFNDVTFNLPGMIMSLQNQSLLTNQSDGSITNPLEKTFVSKLNDDMTAVNTELSTLDSRISGYKKQVDVWIERVKGFETSTTAFKEKVNKTATKQTEHEKTVDNKVKSI